MSRPRFESPLWKIWEFLVCGRCDDVAENSGTAENVGSGGGTGGGEHVVESENSADRGENTGENGNTGDGGQDTGERKFSTGFGMMSGTISDGCDDANPSDEGKRRKRTGGENDGHHAGGNNGKGCDPAAPGTSSAAAATPAAFAGTVDVTANDLAQRFWDRTTGKTSEEQKTVKACEKPFDGLQHLGNTPKHRPFICWLQSIARLDRNQRCYDQELRECSEKADCKTSEVGRMHDLIRAAEKIGNPPNADALKVVEGLIDQYYLDWAYTPGAPVNVQRALTNSEHAIGRKDRFDDSTRTMLGRTSSMRLRHYAEGDGKWQRSARWTNAQIIPVADGVDGPRNFTDGDSLMRYVCREARRTVCSAHDYGVFFTQYLKRPADQEPTYYDGRQMCIYVDPPKDAGKQNPDALCEVPQYVLRLKFRFDSSDYTRQIPVSIDSNTRTFLLEGVIAETADEERHCFNHVLVWNAANADFKCVTLDSFDEPRERDDKLLCTNDRIVAAVFVAQPVVKVAKAQAPVA